jgi:lipopolysaccharide assembly protein A
MPQGTDAAGQNSDAAGQPKKGSVVAEQPYTPAPAQPGAGRAAQKSHTGAYIRLGVIALIVVFALVFVFQNTQRISLHFLSADFGAPLWLMLLIVLLLGGIVGFFLGVRRRKTKRQ